MGARTIFKLAAGLCIISAVSAQYPYNSLQRETGKQNNNARLRPQYANPSYPSPAPPSDPAKFAKIMKQINKVNDDGSYTFGFENDDGSFRVETRTKDGLVKGKFGFVDANGQLKVTEYTAGEKSEDQPSDEGETTESEEEGGDFKRPRPSAPARSLPLSARPQPYAQNRASYQPRPEIPQYVPRQLPLDSRPIISATPSPYRIGARSDVFDQAPAAQTAQEKVAQAPPTSDDDFKESSEDDSDSFSKRQSGSQEDNLNGQYFRQSITPTQGGGSSGGVRGRFPVSGGGNAGSAGRPLYGGANGPSAYAQQYPGFGPSPVPPNQYNFPQGGPQGFPGASRNPQGFPGGAGGLQGFAPSGPAGNPFDIPSGFVGSPDFGAFPVQQGGPQLQGGPQSIQTAPQDFSSIGRQQFGASPQGQRSAPNLQSIQNFGGFGGFNQRQGPSGLGAKGNSNQGGSNDERYIPSVELDGYSEDLDEDGYPDEPPKDGKLPLKAGTTGGSPQNYRPAALGPQGILQGGVPQRASQGGPQGQLILQLGGGPQGGPSQNALGFGAGGRFPGAQQRPAGLIGQQGNGGLPPHYVPQQSFGGFPQGGGQEEFQGFPQGFPQGGFEGGQGFPQQYNPQGVQGGQYSGSPIQGDGFPYDFSPFAGGQGFQGSPGAGQGFQGVPGGAQGFPLGNGVSAPFPQSNYPGVQNFGGFPGGAQGFPIQGGPSRFSSGGGSGSGANGGQSFISGGQFGGLGNIGQASPTPSGASSSPSSSEVKKP